MGVDYTGSGPLYALGSGVITNVTNSGWPGGKFIGLKLDSGQYMYYAENIISKVSVGQRVTAGQQIGQAVGTSPYVEIGWAAPPGTGNALAATTGEAALGQSQGDAGKYSTAYGVSMSNLIASLGGPPGIVSPGGIQGTVGAGYPSGTDAQLTSASSGGTTASGCVPMIWIIWLLLQTLKRIAGYLKR